MILLPSSNEEELLLIWYSGAEYDRKRLYTGDKD